MTEKRQRDPARSRAAILDAAEELFARHGYHGASLREIGEAAGLSRGTPGYFFGSKEGLYRAVLGRALEYVGAAMREERQRVRSSGGTPEDVLSREIDLYMDFLVDRPTFVRLIEWESLSGGEILAEFAPHVETITESVRMVEDELDRGGVHGADPVQLMLSVMGLCWFPLSQADTLMKALGRDPYDPEFVSERKRHIKAVVLGGLGLHEGA